MCRAPRAPRTPTARLFFARGAKTPSVQGKFDVARAKALGIPPGPLFGVLKGGESVTLADGRRVLPSEVVGAGHPGAACLVVHVADASLVPALLAHAAFAPFYARATGAERARRATTLDVVVHLTPAAVATRRDTTRRSCPG